MHGRLLLRLGAIEREVGAAEQLLLGVAAMRMQPDAGPRSDAVVDSPNVDGCFNAGDEPVGQFADIVAMPNGSAENGEFIAAQAGHDIVAVDDGLHPPRDRLQNPVADGMSVLIVDGLGPVEIEQQQRMRPRAVRMAEQRSRDRFQQRPAVRQTSQWIAHRQVARLVRSKFRREAALEFALLLLQAPKRKTISPTISNPVRPKNS